MFKKRRSVVTAAPPAPGSAAALAASQAFLKDRASHPTLSSAAAAAALRSHSTTPTQVGDVQTKRMARRGSVSSNGSAAEVSSRQGAPSLQRRGSSGSMTERTFRGNQTNQNNLAVDTQNNIPPVPAIPKDVTDTSHRRASSLDPPQRIISPEPNQADARGSSVDGAKRVPAARPTNLQNVQELEREDSRRSVNFSRPMSPQNSPKTSPTPNSGRAGHSGWHASPISTGNDTRHELAPIKGDPQEGLAIDLAHTKQEYIAAAERPVSKKKKTVAPELAEGSRLASGTMGAKPYGSAVQHEAGPKKDLRVETRPARHQERMPEGLVPANTSRKVDIERSVSPANRSRAASDSIPPAASGDVQRSKTVSVSTPSSYLQTSEDDTLRTDRETRRSREDNRQSVSPARSARFSAVALELPNSVLHNPPPRSLSPAKSALKHSPAASARTSSPMASHAAKAPSETSDTVSDDGHRTPGKKKKNVRVSFDEHSLLASEKDEIAQMVSAQRPESPRGLEASKWRTSLDAPEDDMDVLKPRPALPSFGSVRARRPSEEDVMAEKVTETVSSSLSTSISSIPEPVGQSKDHALGSIIAQDFATRHASKPSDAHDKKPGSAPLDPLPPEVTSVEGSGYASDSDESSSPEAQLTPVIEKDEPVDEVAATQSDSSDEDFSIADEKDAQETEAPSIHILPATPQLEKDGELKLESKQQVEERPRAMVVPGGWDEESDEPEAQKVEIPKAVTSETRPQIKAEPEPEPKTLSQSAVISQQATKAPSQSSSQNLAVPAEDSSDEGDSIYSDAAEDMSDDEGGFASLDAMVESPLTGPTLAFGESKLAGAPESLSVATPSPPSRATKFQTEEEKDEDWRRAKEYWSGLTESQKQELESMAKKGSADKKAVAAQTKAPLTPPEAKKPAKPATVAAEPSRPKKKTTTAPATTSPTPAPTQRATKATSPPVKVSPRNAPPGPSILKPSMRRSQDVEPLQPQSARATRDAPMMRQSMRGNATGPAASKYSTDSHEAREPRGALQKKNIPAQTRQAQPAQETGGARGRLTAAPKQVAKQVAKQVPPPLATTSKWDKGDDSDASDSSFKRERPRRNRGGGFAMRRTMRGSQQDASPPSAPTMRPTSPPSAGLASSKYSMRPLSPQGNTMRRSMRSDSADLGAPMLRSQPAAAPPSKSRFGGFGRSKNKSAAAPSSPKHAKPAPRFQSRFADSSDEDEPRPSHFRSRFAADSDSDDDLPLAPPPTAGFTPTAIPTPRAAPTTGLAPVRGIPRRPGDEDRDSTDLEDENSDTRSPPRTPRSTKPAAATTATPPTNGLRSSKHASPAPGEPGVIGGAREKKRRSFFGLGKKKKDAPAASPTFAPAPEAPSSPAAPTVTTIPEEPTPAPTPATEAPPAATTVRPRSPKLQRRTTPQRVLSADAASFPHPPPPVPDAAEDGVARAADRPSTSDGTPAGARRPLLAKRFSSSRTAPGGGGGEGEAAGKGGKKKKKFPGLRKMFKLDD